MKEFPLISVIVPVYKVEPYIHRCINSIIHQTYQNLEIILVDDGSPDRCGQICDEYAANDTRIQVIHQQNQGLSAARNAGLDSCKGEYIGFVDSDDCIHPEMYERLYSDIVTHHVLLAFCQPNMCDEVIPDIEGKESTVCQDKEFVILKSMEENIWWSAWTKLYHRSLFESIRYPQGKTNEDYAVTIFIYDHCERIAINYNKLYNYCIRENSICTSPLNIRKFDQIENTEAVVFYMQEKHPDWKPAADYVFFTTLLKLLGMADEDLSHSFKDQEIRILTLIKKYISDIKSNPYLLAKQKMMLVSAYIHPLFFHFLNKLYVGVQRLK